MNNSLDALGLINEIKADVLLQKCSSEDIAQIHLLHAKTQLLLA